MKKTKEPIVHYCLCGAEHPGEQVKPGWYAIYKTDKRVKLERLIRPNCLQRLGIKANQSVKPIAQMYQMHDTVDNQPQQIRLLL